MAALAKADRGKLIAGGQTKEYRGGFRETEFSNYTLSCTMFSTRFHWDLRPNRIARQLEQKRRVGVPILDLTESNPTRAGLHYPAEILGAFQDERILGYDPQPAGMMSAREAVAGYYAERGIAVEPERILLTASTSEAYAYLFKLLADPGDHILVPRPSYPLFEFLAAMESITARPYPLVCCGGWAINWEALEAALTDRTRAIILVNPNNPTGSYVKDEELQRLAALSRDREIALISDEVFSDYAFDSDRARVATLAGVEQGLAFSLSGLSKVAGLPQMKLGWIVVSGSVERRAGAWERLEWIADNYLSAGTPVQCAAAGLLAAGKSVREQIRRRTLENLQLARGAIVGTAASALALEGGWYLTLQVPALRTEEEWTVELLDRWNVLAQPGYFFDFDSEAFLIVSLLTHPAIFQEGMGRLLKCIAALSSQVQ
jgi:aspartate/methionine/tyrosine aminotransferase